MSTSAPLPPRASPPLWLLGTFVATYCYLAFASRPPAAGGDTLRDFLMARDCSALGRCHTMGAASTVHGLFQGAAWLHLIAAVQTLGGGPMAVQRVVLMGFAAAVAVLSWVTARWVAPTAGVVAGVTYAAALAALGNAVVLWNHSPVALPATLAVCAGGLLARTGRTRFALAAGAMTGLAVTLHLEGAVLLPGLLATAVIAGRRPWIASGGLLAAALGAVAVSSFEMLKEDGGWALGQGMATVMGVALFAVGAIGSRVRPRWERMGAGARSAVYAALLLGTSSLGGVWLWLSQHHVVHPHYADAALPAVCATAGALVAAAGRLFPRTVQKVLGVALLALAGGGLVRIAMAARIDQGHWTLDDHQRVARALFHDGASWDAVKLGIEGPRCHDAITGLALFAPAPAAHQPRDVQRAFALVRLDPMVAVQARQIPGFIPLEGGAGALVQPVESWLDRRAMQVCITAGAGVRTCRPILPDPREYVGPERFLFGRRSYPEAHSFAPAEPYTMEYEFDVTPREDSTPWRIDLLDDSTARCPWQITRVEGIQVDGNLPGASVLLHPSTGRGKIVMGRHYDARACGPAVNRRLPPCLIESSPGNDAVATWARRLR